MKQLFLLASVLFQLSLSAQQVGFPLEKRTNLERSSSFDSLTTFSNKKITSTSLLKSNREAWSKSADEVISPLHRIYSVDMVDSNTIWMVSTYDNFPPPADTLPYVLKSLDSGVTWEQYSIPGTEGDYAFDVAATDEQTTFVVMNDGNSSPSSITGNLYKTENGGQDWEMMESYPFAPSFVHFFDESNGWVLGGDTTSSDINFLYMSVTDDGGETWSHAGGNNWVIPEGRSLGVQDSSELVGTWTFSVNSVYEVVDSVILVGGSKRYWISDDYGYNWNSFDSPLAPSHAITIVAMKNRDTFMLASNFSQDIDLLSPVSYTTTDGGETWIQGTPPGHLSAIHYLPGTEQSFISVGHFNFGVGAVGTFRTNDFINWENVDDLPLIAMDFAGEKQGTGVLGNIPALGDNGNIYKWDQLPPFLAEVALVDQGFYTISKVEHLQDVFFSYTVESAGLEALQNVTAQLEVFRDGQLIYTDQSAIEVIEAGITETFVLEYQPEVVGVYEYQVRISEDNLGNTFFEDNHIVEVSPNTLAKDDGTMESFLTWNPFSPADAWGYIGTTFELQESDTLRSISVAIDNASEIDATFYLAIYGFNEDGVPEDLIYQSDEILVSDALAGGVFYEDTLETILILEADSYLFAVGQDTLQGVVNFSMDDDNIDGGDYWQFSPQFGNAWQNFPNSLVPTVGIRARFVESNASAENTARVQFIHNAAFESVRLSANGEEIQPSLAYRTATPYLDVAAGTSINLLAAPANPSSTTSPVEKTVELEAGATYVITLQGTFDESDDQPVEVAILENAREMSDDVNETVVQFFHGSPDAPDIDITSNDNVLFDDISYGDFGDEYIRVSTGSNIINITPAGDNSEVLATYELQLGFWKGRSAVIFATGSLEAGNFVPWVALSNGGTFPLFTPEQEMAISPMAASTSDHVVRLIPNPVSQEFQITLDIPFESSATIMLYTSNGLVLKEKQLGTLQRGIHQYQFNVDDFPNGTYFLQVITGDTHEVVPVVVTH